MSKVYTSIDQLIGHTPLLELTHFEADEDLKARVLVKLEYFNPAGSVKDRVAKNMMTRPKSCRQARARRRLHHHRAHERQHRHRHRLGGGSRL